MNFISDIIIVALLSVFLLIVVAIIFYKLGKREKLKIIINERDRIIENENETTSQKVELPEKKEFLKEEIIIDTNNKPAENKLVQENMLSVKELYSKKIEEEMNNAESSIDGEKLSDFKFLKYTSNGYKPAKGDKESRVVRWR
ncbi:MAG: hypothetical protein WBV81_12185 [Ignavibacteriaceae bacterium]